MTGPEHYRKAEALMLGAARFASQTDTAPPDLEQDYRDSVMASIAAAQVHATLALAAATALPVGDGLPSDAWLRAAGGRE